KTAIRNFSRASELAEAPVPALHTKLAELYVRSKELNKALAESNKALAAAPTDPKMLLLHAGILEALERDDEAEPIYEKVIKEHPTNTDAYLLLSNLYIRRKETGRAIELLTKLTKVLPTQPDPWYYLGLAYEMTDDFSSAEKHLRKSYSIA